MNRKLNIVLLVSLALCLFNGCTDSTTRSKPEAPYSQRYVPVGNNPDVALDTQTGMLCRTVEDAGAPLGILDSRCGVSEQEKSFGFVPKTCNSGKTWVLGQDDKRSSSYNSIPVCDKVIVVTEDDMKKAAAK